MISLLIEFMETEKWGLTGNQFIYATYVLGAIIGAIIVGYGLTVGNNLNSNKQKLDDDGRIHDLELKISILDTENKVKQDSIERMAFELIGFSNKIDSNTSATKTLVGEIQELSSKTNTVADQINKDQKSSLMKEPIFLSLRYYYDFEKIKFTDLEEELDNYLNNSNNDIRIYRNNQRKQYVSYRLSHTNFQNLNLEYNLDNCYSIDRDRITEPRVYVTVQYKFNFDGTFNFSSIEKGDTIFLIIRSRYGTISISKEGQFHPGKLTLESVKFIQGGMSNNLEFSKQPNYSEVGLDNKYRGIMEVIFTIPNE
tara:strand:- start:2205 stop:3137 length:933 start_codon:yes stop_codon:yes gene_type:complete